MIVFPIWLETNDVNIELKDRKAIVTGSTAGIGRATAEGLARAGATVVINGRGNARVDRENRARDNFLMVW